MSGTKAYVAIRRNLAGVKAKPNFNKVLRPNSVSLEFGVRLGLVMHTGYPERPSCRRRAPSSSGVCTISFVERSVRLNKAAYALLVVHF